jgi:L-alanine-DL-glutamate epimerase-like enolase superfamily enzyme
MASCVAEGFQAVKMEIGVTVDDGVANVPQKPGLGIELNEAAVARDKILGDRRISQTGESRATYQLREVELCEP